MVLLKMLMKIGPPMVRGSLVMSMASISPSRREVSPAESLRRRAKVLLPKFRLETMALHPKSLLLIFSRANGIIQVKMGPGGLPGSPQARGRAPRLVAAWWVPSGIFFSQYFLFIPKCFSVNFQDFWSCAEQVSNICSFSQNSSCRHSPSSYESCKIREKRHKNCTIK